MWLLLPKDTSFDILYWSTKSQDDWTKISINPFSELLYSFLGFNSLPNAPCQSSYLWMHICAKLTSLWPDVDLCWSFYCQGRAVQLSLGSLFPPSSAFNCYQIIKLQFLNSFFPSLYHSIFLAFLFSQVFKKIKAY